MAAHRAARTSWSVKWARKDEEGNVTRWRHHYNASLGRQGTPAEHEAAREQAVTSARAKAKELTQDPSVLWVTVFPPFKYAIFNQPYSTERLAPVAKWTRRKGWTNVEAK
jgi:hypothetical protein